MSRLNLWLALTLSGAAIQGQPVTLVQNDYLWVSYIDRGETVELDIEVGEDVLPMVRVDVNENGSIDPRLDTYYATSHGAPCTGFLLTETSTTPCRAFHSSATLSVVEGRNHDRKQFIWIVPKSELGNRSSGASIAVSTFNEKTNQWLYFSNFRRPYKLNYVPRPPR